MLRVFGIRTPFQILNPIVGLDSVDVVDAWFVVGIWNESQCDEPMRPDILFSYENLLVSPDVDTLFSYSHSRIPVAFDITPYVSKRTRFISGITRYFFPNFHVRKKRISRGRICDTDPGIRAF